MMDIYDGHTLDLKNKGLNMDDYGCGSSRIRFYWSVTWINLRWNVLKWWIVDLFIWIDLWN